MSFKKRSSSVILQTMLTVLTGKNEFLLQMELQKLQTRAISEWGELGIERIDAESVEFDTVLQIVQSVPFLVSGKLVIVRNAQSNTALLERIEELHDRIADGVEVVLVGPQFDKRKASWNIMKKLADRVIECSEVKPFELPKWVQAQAKELGCTISTSDATYLVERAGANQLLLNSEIQKLALRGNLITRESIDELIEPSPQSTIFEMIDAAFSGNGARALSLYREQRQQRVDPQYIIAMLTWQLQALALAVYAKPATEGTLVAAGQSPFTAKKALRMASKVNARQIRTYINDLASLDRAVKTNADSDAALELYILSLSVA